jgi:hypothetical protein
MQKEHIYFGIIALGILAPVIYFVTAFSSGEKLDSPGVLEEKVLHGESVDERVNAAQGLIQHGTAARKEVRRALAASRQNDPEVRAYLLQAAMGIKDWRSLPEMFAAMEDPDATIRGRGATAAVKIMGMDFGFRANDPPEKRKKILAEMRREYKASEPKYPQFYSDQEE